MIMAKNRKKNDRFNRTLALTTALIILIVASVSSTIAFLITDTDPITNVFIPSKVTTEVYWDTDSETGFTAKVTNTSDINSYIRAAVVVNWVKTDPDGTRHVHSEAPIEKAPLEETPENCDYTIKYNGNTWICKEYDNGEIIYYFTKPVEPGKNTTNLISQFKQLRDGPEGYELEIEIVASGIQSVPVTVVEDKWGVVLDNSGNIVSVKDHPGIN